MVPLLDETKKPEEEEEARMGELLFSTLEGNDRLGKKNGKLSQEVIFLKTEEEKDKA